MSSGHADGLRVALLLHSYGRNGEAADAWVGEIAGALTAWGHRPSVVRAEPFDLAEGLLRRRGFAGSLTRIPTLVAKLRRGSYEVVEAFSPLDAEAGLLSRRLGGPPVVFTPAVAPSRANLADRRRSFRQAIQSYGKSDAVLALDREIQTEVKRWLALDVDVVAPADVATRVAVYERCILPPPTRGSDARRGRACLR
jgi:hypothetical protein